MSITVEQLKIISNYLQYIDILNMPGFLKLIAEESQVVKKEFLSEFIEMIGVDECPIRKMQSLYPNCREPDNQLFPLFNLLLGAMVAKKKIEGFIALCKKLSLASEHLQTIVLAGKTAYQQYITPAFSKTLIQPTDTKLASYNVSSSEDTLSGHVFYYWGANIQRSTAIIISSLAEDKRYILPEVVEAEDLHIEEIDAKHLYTVFTFEEKIGASISGAVPATFLEQRDQTLNKVFYSGLLTPETTNQIFSLLGIQILVNKMGANLTM